GTEMFHFPAFPPHHLYIQWRVPQHDSRQVSPFGHPRITGRLSPSRGLSQTPTSFVGSLCQGVHRAPFKTSANTKTHNVYKLLTRCSRPLCSSQETTPHQHHPANTAAAPGRTSHTPHTHHQPLDEQGIPATVGPRAASQPNSVSP